MGNKCMFCIPEEEAKDVGDDDICKECAENGLKTGIFKEINNG